MFCERSAGVLTLCTRMCRTQKAFSKTYCESEFVSLPRSSANDNKDLKRTILKLSELGALPPTKMCIQTPWTQSSEDGFLFLRWCRHKACVILRTIRMCTFLGAFTVAHTSKKHFSFKGTVAIHGVSVTWVRRETVSAFLSTFIYTTAPRSYRDLSEIWLNTAHTKDCT